MLRRIFASWVPDGDWAQMNRPMADSTDEKEQKQRRAEYSAMLEALHAAEMMYRTDPDDSDGFPARILKWQYEMGLVLNYSKDSRPEGRLLKPARNPVEFRSEYARSLALFIVSQDARMSEEHLTKLCRGYDPPPSSQL